MYFGARRVFLAERTESPSFCHTDGFSIWTGGIADSGVLHRDPLNQIIDEQRIDENRLHAKGNLISVLLMLESADGLDKASKLHRLVDYVEKHLDQPEDRQATQSQKNTHPIRSSTAATAATASNAPAEATPYATPYAAPYATPEATPEPKTAFRR
jgi:hypothetical protein